MSTDLAFAVKKILFLVSLTVLNITKPTICSPDDRLVNPFLENQDDSNNGRQLVWYTQNDTNIRRDPVTHYYFFNLTIQEEPPADDENLWNSYTVEMNNDGTSVSQDRENGAGSVSNREYHKKIEQNNKGQTEFNSQSNWDGNSFVKRKSEIKCEEYGEAVSKKVLALALVGTDPGGIPISKTTGKCEGLHTPLIVSGTKTRAGEFPHMAAIGWLNSEKLEYLCGGSLISDRWILTAAHCTHSHLGSPSVVRLGANSLTDNGSGKLVTIKKIERHPGYKPPAMYADIALLKLETPVRFTDEIRPACLYQKYDVSPAQGWVTGWGAVETGGDRSDVLLKARLDILDNLACTRKYNQSISIPRGVVPSMVCAGDVTNNWQSDTCQADSGGPLQIVHPKIGCLHQIVGITSFGILCAVQDFPGIYTRVSHYLDWIEERVWPETME